MTRIFATIHVKDEENRLSFYATTKEDRFDVFIEDYVKEFVDKDEVTEWLDAMSNFVNQARREMADAEIYDLVLEQYRESAPAIIAAEQLRSVKQGLAAPRDSKPGIQIGAANLLTRGAASET